MKIAYFASGGLLGLLPLEQLAQQHDILAVVRPTRHRPYVPQWLLRWRRHRRGTGPDPIEQFSRARHIPILAARLSHDPRLLSQLAALQPDLICISTFSWLLPAALFTLPPYGAINLHTSLLPRHRGPTPLFWIYYHDDRQTGVTVHVVNARADAGPILCQEAFPLPRGFNIVPLHREKAQRGARLLGQAIDMICKGKAKGVPQDKTLVTPAPRVQRGRRMVPFMAWDVERVWHFLAGLYPQFVEPLTDHTGRTIVYNQVLGYTTENHTRMPGTLDATADGWQLFCQGGAIRLG